METIHVISVSGGKDSGATRLVAIEKGIPHIAVFADTGNEHQSTYDYLDYLEEKTGPIVRVKADFSKRILKHRAFVANDQRTGRKYKYVTVGRDDEGKPIKKKTGAGRKVRWSNKAKRRALENMYPTGNPFLDLCILKGRFPSTRARFCSQELKRELIDDQVAVCLSWPMATK
ncbi:MAG: phosphoadenosine phosphosulfate reductase family protein [Desulfobulbaceae bacterium]|nr:phosphoadenosine phosphosulfate reductase family protein [Desulfobulbaceae bacterium]